MPLLKTLFINKILLFLVVSMVSLSAMALDFNETQRLANQGDVESQFYIGRMYSQGEGVRQDYTKAREWYEKAANQGDASSQANLGYIYQYGEGVRQDYAKAREWYTKSANQGIANAQLNLGYLYYKGKGVRQDYATAQEWFGKACDNGEQKGCDGYKDLNQ